MATTVTAQDVIRPASSAEAVLRRPTRSLWSDALRQFRRHRLAMFGVFTFILLLVATLLGPLVYRASPDAIDYSQGLLGPSLAHPFGTDDLGRDLLARTLLGGRVSMAVGVMAMLLAIIVGTLVGAIAGYFGELVDNVLMRVTDLFLALPALPLLLMLVYLFRDPLRASFGPVIGIFILVVAVIGGLTWMPVARLVRASFLSVRDKEFIVASRALGSSNVRIIALHILPNVMSPIVVAATLAVG